MGGQGSRGTRARQSKGSRAEPLEAFLGATESDARVLNSASRKSKLASSCLTCRGTRHHGAVLRLLPAHSRFSLHCCVLEGLSVCPSVRSHSEGRERFFRSAEHPWQRCRADERCQPCCGVARWYSCQNFCSIHGMLEVEAQVRLSFGTLELVSCMYLNYKSLLSFKKHQAFSELEVWQSKVNSFLCMANILQQRDWYLRVKQLHWQGWVGMRVVLSAPLCCKP